jgi:hypothetical protein
MKRMLLAATAIAALATPAYAGSWWVLSRDGDDSAEADQCMRGSGALNAPANVYDYMAQSMRLPEIKDHGDEVDVEYDLQQSEGVGRGYIRFFHTSEGCLQASEAVKADAAAREKYR